MAEAITADTFWFKYDFIHHFVFLDPVTGSTLTYLQINILIVFFIV